VKTQKRAASARGVSAHPDGVQEILLEIGKGAAAAPGVECYLVGGSVRDLLMRRKMRDVDVSVEGSAECALSLSKKIGSLRAWTLEATHLRFGTATLIAPSGRRVDIAATRTEVYPRPAALPVVSCGVPIGEDLARRDFTVNAMARRIASDGSLGPLIDPHGGNKDLEENVLRLLHKASLVDDPTRAYRAVRYAVKFGFTLEKQFRKPLARAREAGAFEGLSGDRMRRGIEEIFLESEYEKALVLAHRLHLLGDVLPAWSSAYSPSKKNNPPAPASLKLGARRPIESEARPVPSEERWAFLLSPLSAENRKRVAERLSFSRKLRRAAGVPLR
jgi:tRNA nucleotidyltransferase (CCA-adding enzyme)